MKIKHYFCQGREITQEEAAAIDRENERLLASPAKADWLKIKCVTVMQEEVKKMSEAEKNLARQIQQAADSIPASLRAAALEKTSTYISGLADMARLVAPGKEDQPHE